MITGLVVAAVLTPAAIWCLRNPAPAPGLRSVLLGCRLDEAQRAAGRPSCPDCTPDQACHVHDGLYWMALEQKEGLR